MNGYAPVSIFCPNCGIRLSLIVPDGKKHKCSKCNISITITTSEDLSYVIKVK
jgi:hypothetical protein